MLTIEGAKKEVRKLIDYLRENNLSETEIMELEEKKSELEARMANTDFSIVQKAGVEYQSVSELLEKKYARWEELAELE